MVFFSRSRIWSPGHDIWKKLTWNIQERNQEVVTKCWLTVDLFLEKFWKNEFWKDPIKTRKTWKICDLVNKCWPNVDQNNSIRKSYIWATFYLFIISPYLQKFKRYNSIYNFFNFFPFLGVKMGTYCPSSPVTLVALLNLNSAQTGNPSPNNPNSAQTANPSPT